MLLINLLELNAVHNARQHFLPIIRQRTLSLGHQLLGSPSSLRGCTPSLHFPTLSPAIKSAPQDTSGTSQGHPHSPHMATTGISLPLVHGGLSTNHHAVDSTPPLPGDRPGSPSESRTSPSEGLAPSWFQDPEITCSEGVKEILLNNRCPTN